MIHVLIADDHPIVREGLKCIISDCSDMKVVGEVENGTEVLTRCAIDSIDVLLLDINMPGLGYLELISRLRKKNPDLRILVLSVNTEDNFASRAYKAGASGYLVKDRSPGELTKAIRQVSKGKLYVTTSFAEKMALGLSSEHTEDSHEVLSDREYQVFCMLALSKQNSDIATELTLSPRTISTYRTRIFQKMKFRNISELIHYAINNNLVE